MKQRWGWLAGAIFLFWAYVSIALATTLYQTTPAPKITYSYDVGIKVATDSDTPLKITNQALTDAQNTNTGIFVKPTSSASWGVTGTFWQVTQPVSGTFWQATQPVSIADDAGSDTIVNLVLTTAGTVYSYTLPANCTAYEYQCASYGSLRFAKSAEGIVSNYRTYLGPFNMPIRDDVVYSGTLYFRDSTQSGTVVELTIYTK